MKVVILAGGQGTRLREETEFRPKPMVEIGGKPILWHLMKSFTSFQINEFILCLGYKGEMIREYFINYQLMQNDITVDIGRFSEVKVDGDNAKENWKVTLADTGPLTPTGGRIFKIRNYIEDDFFICTYGDGLADVNINELINFHRAHGKTATVTAVRPATRFGALSLGTNNLVTNFAEKPRSDYFVNGGFFIFNKNIFDYLDDSATLELEPMTSLVKDEELIAFPHNGFWQPMDTFRESKELNELWDINKAPWKNW